MDLHLLGPIEARLDGRPIELGARQQRAVLAMLALQVGRTVQADRLAEGLWGEQPPPSAPKMVQQYVSHLRGLLAGNGAEIVTRGRGYRFAAWDAERGGFLVRNPHFRSWSPQARPAGFADRIEVSVRGQQDVGAQVAEVRRGTADVAVLANLFKPLFPAERIGALAARSPGQIHSYPEPVLNSMFLNVLRPPFDDVDARRALNYATDRARIAELEGGRDLATPTCQVLPSGFPGHEPYCPYTAQSGPGRAWSAPDMGRARALVAESGTAGERVVVTVPDFQRDVGRYFTALLGRLGYRASLRVLGGSHYFEVIYDPKSRVQIGFSGWSSDYLSPSTFIEPNFGCTGNLSHFCDRRLDRQVDRALAARGADAAERWAAIDRRVTDLAPAVPLTNRRSMELVSRRVGNVQHHMQASTLLDQLWVR